MKIVLSSTFLYFLINTICFGQNTIDQSRQQALEIILESVKSSITLEGSILVDNIVLQLDGIAFDEGQSKSPYSDWFEREMSTQIIFQPKHGRSYQSISTITIGGLLYDPIFIINSDSEGIMTNKSTNEWFELKGMDIPILKSIPQLYPPRLFPFYVLQETLQASNDIELSKETESSYFITVMGQQGGKTTLVVDKESKLLNEIQFMSDHLVFGDNLIRIEFSNYKTIQGMNIPKRYRFYNGQLLFMDLEVSAIEINQENVDSKFQKPESAEFIELPKTFDPIKIREGIWSMPVFAGLGTTYNVLLVEFNDYFLVMDAPLFDGYSRGIEQIVNRLSPSKPIKYVVATHYHTDHIGGINYFLKKGAEVIANSNNLKFLDEISKVEHNLYSNQGNETTVGLKLSTFDKKKTLTDGSQKLSLFEINNNPHVEDMILAYLPDEKILFVADLLMVPENGELPPSNESKIFLENFLKKNNLEVDLFVPSHGPIITKDFFNGIKPQKKKSTVSQSKLVARAVNDYIDAFYLGDTTKLKRGILKEANKYGYYRERDKKEYIGEPMSYQQMVDYAVSVKARPIPQSAPRKIEILDLQDQTAAAKLTAWWGTDYVLLGKYDDDWKIVQVLWQSRPPRKSF